MAERDIIVDKMRMTYEGLFSVSELYKMMDEWFEEKNYDKKELKNVENVTPEGKYVEILIEPWKKVTDYAKNVIRIRMIMTNIKDVEVEKDGVKVRLNQGKIQMVFDAYLETDYENRWEQKPMFFLIRTLFDKYFYKPFTHGFHAGVKADLNDLVTRIKSFLNLYRY
jgi:hypothetical protein